MNYNYYFEICALLISIILLYDYKSKSKYLKRETRMFQLVIIVSILEFFVNLLSSIMILHTMQIPVIYNIIVATLFFVLQAAMLFCIVLFSFLYMNPHLKKESTAVYLATAIFVANVGFSLISPFTHFYFYFNEQKQYVQGYGADLGYLFYLINVALCLGYVLYNRHHLLRKDMKVAGIVALFVGFGFVIQFFFKSILMLDFSIALTILYMYMTLENPNDSLDKLTLCGNGYVFRQLVDESCEKRNPFSVIFLDIRKFSFINASYGIETGDMLLKQVATFLEQAFPAQLIFRTHDDVFALLVQKRQSELHPMIQTIIDQFDCLWELPGHITLKLEPFLTICEYPNCFLSHSELIKLESNMIVKQKGIINQNILFSDKTMYHECLRLEKVEHILRRSLQEHTLQVHYQPIINCNKQTVESLEALSRLYDDELGYIPPDEFIPIAESTGMIIPLGFYVIENVCQFIQDHLLHNPENTVSCIHINISTLQCGDTLFCHKLKEIMVKYVVPPQMIQLELTESTMLCSPKKLSHIMNELHAYGVLFALDDYGTGYSNISYLIQFPFHEIKFDKTLVQSCFKDENAFLIIKNEFQTLTQLKKRIILEGIETKEQYEDMKKQNISLFQGFFFSKPLSKEACLDFLNKMNNEPEQFF